MPQYVRTDPATPLELYEMGDVAGWTKLADRAYAEHVNVDPVWRFEHSDDANGSNGVTSRATSSDRSRFYVVRLLATREGLFVGCQCQAGQHQRPCKHLARLLVEEGVLERPEWIPDALTKQAARMFMTRPELLDG